MRIDDFDQLWYTRTFRSKYVKDVTVSRVLVDGTRSKTLYDDIRDPFSIRVYGFATVPDRYLLHGTQSLQMLLYMNVDEEEVDFRAREWNENVGGALYTHYVMNARKAARAALKRALLQTVGDVWPSIYNIFMLVQYGELVARLTGGPAREIETSSGVIYLFDRIEYAMYVDDDDASVVDYDQFDAIAESMGHPRE